MGYINFVEDRNHFEIVFHRRIGVGHGLRFHALKCINEQQGAFAAGQ